MHGLAQWPLTPALALKVSRMLEIIMLVAAVVGISRVARAQEMSSGTWGGLTALACIPPEG